MPYTTVLRGALSLLCALSLIGIRTANAAPLSKSQIQELVKPIALYPDPLLQQILPASTFPDQIADAALLIRSKSDAVLIQDQRWDESVKVIANYSGVLKMMYDKLDWTIRLGEAFLAQHEEVLSQIQQLRLKAQQYGNLSSSKEQTVTTETAPNGNTYITIVPSDPQVVYVPKTTTTVYTQPAPAASNALVPIATFGLGLAIGAAMNNDDDHHHYYYGGPMWYGGGYNDWVDRRYDSIDNAVNKRHDFREDRQDFHQEQARDRQDARQEWAKNNPDKVTSENLNKAKQNSQANRQQRQQNYQANSGQRQQQLNNARSNMQAQGYGNGTRSYSTGSSAGSWTGQGGASYANRASNRGAYSRSTTGSFGGAGGGVRAGGGRRR